MATLPTEICNAVDIDVRSAECSGCGTDCTVDSREDIAQEGDRSCLDRTVRSDGGQGPRSHWQGEGKRRE